MSTELYDYYLEHGGPPLPEGYSFYVWRDEYDDAWEYRVSILAPKRKWRKRKKELLTAQYPWRYSTYWSVPDSARRTGEPPPVAWFTGVLRETYADWRAVTYEADMRGRWNAYLGEHP